MNIIYKSFTANSFLLFYSLQSFLIFNKKLFVRDNCMILQFCLSSTTCYNTLIVNHNDYLTLEF